ncbi:MAG: hypothetical protein M3464_01910 [Chloroflexota bacterium]|nr:hypothetical protein [Chloroflexota bacterium]
MVLQQEKRTVRFAGSPKDRALAARVFDLVLIHARFMSATAPVRISLASIAAFLDQRSTPASIDELRAALVASPKVFALEQIDDETVLLTSRAGQVPSLVTAPSRHTFAQRFMTPLPKPERPAQPVRERPRVYPAWATLPSILEGSDEEEDFDFGPELDGDEPAADPVELIEIVPEPVVTEAPEPEAAVIIEAEPAIPPARTITLPVAAPTDVTGVDDLELAAAIQHRLGADARVANFGEHWLMEDRVPRLSRGDLRRLKDYLQEREQPLTDDDLTQVVLGVRPGTAEFELARFATNFRLSREHREFEFVGTTNQRFWTTSGLPAIGTTRRKPNELGTDYRFLLEELPAEPAYRSLPATDHTLTFYEYVHGLLPYDARLQALLPAPLVPNQRSAVLTFECPQSFTTYLVELRYPTPNRGGYILGLDDFYTDHLVPGALISISRTENDGHYRVEFIAESDENARLLELDERRTPRYVFRPTSYRCGVDPKTLLTEEKFGRFNGEKPVDEKIRRRPESVVAVTFERVGDSSEGNLSAEFATLLAGVNVERPISATLLRTVFDNDDSGAFSRDPEKEDAYTYVPGNTP